MFIGALFIFEAASCGKSTEKEQEVPVAAPTVLSTIQFQNTCEDAGGFTETQFETAAHLAFRRVTQPGIQVGRGVLVGKLAETDGQTALSLSIRLSVNGLAKPVETSLFATAAARLPVSEMVQKGLSDLSIAVKELLHLIHATQERQIEALASAELDVQLWAAFLLGEASVLDAVKPLCFMLGDPRDEAAEAAAEALKKIGATTAVPLIIQSIRRGDLRSEVRAIEVMGRIGGKEAEAYLEMTAVGHEIREVRHLSQSLLETLQKSSTR